MTDTTYRVVFSGSPLPGTDRDTAINNFAQLFKRTPEQVGGAFSGKPSVLKKGVSQAEAEKYCRVLEKAGLAVRAEAETPPPAARAAVSLSLQDENSAPVAAVAAPAEPEIPVVAPPKISASLALVEEDGDKEEITADGKPAMMTCPACGHEQHKADVCERCNVVIAKFLQRQAEKKQQQAEQGNLWPEAPDAGDESPTEPETPAPTFLGKLMGMFRRK